MMRQTAREKKIAQGENVSALRDEIAQDGQIPYLQIISMAMSCRKRTGEAPYSAKGRAATEQMRPISSMQPAFRLSPGQIRMIRACARTWGPKASNNGVCCCGARRPLSLSGRSDHPDLLHCAEHCLQK